MSGAITSTTRARSCGLPAADGQWWQARQPLRIQCGGCGRLSVDPPAVMSYSALQDHGGQQARLNPRWPRDGWVWWRECATCGWQDFITITVTLDQIRAWQVGPWARR
jgi:hypothetical protein